MNWIKEKERTYHLGIAEGFKRAAVVCESEILSEDVEPMPKDKASVSERMKVDQAKLLAPAMREHLAKLEHELATLSEGPEHG
jgi:hypothetical protein